MRALFAESALLPDGWARAVRIAVDDTGTIAALTADAAAEDAERLAGPVLPGLPNLHSHAFQRAMAGLTERAGPAGDDFWSWRQAMYRFLAVLTPEDVQAIAAQLYVEMVKAGFTAVGEFHYLHHDRDGTPYADRATMAEAVIAAARQAGIGLTLLPTLYCANGFGGAPPSAGQRRFIDSAAGVLALRETLARRHAGDPQLRLGLAVHSLRAVPPEALDEAVDGLRAADPAAPLHLHIAEQLREVEECVAWCGRRPAAWLLDRMPVDERWCLVHATHVDAGETAALAASGAVVGLCPTTEADLGDGLFPFGDFAAAGGRWGVGSDSHVSVSPVEELRWLEYGQRLRHRRRNLAAGAGASTGPALWQAAAAGGARALGRPLGRLAPGCRADLLVLDGDAPALYGRRGDALVDALVFSGNVPTIRDVMVGGSWRVRDGRHAAEDAVASAFRRTLDRVLAALD
ncbi:MAG TPA: formimidoylglutamate deiminase, partial [Stellaceae bacterium]|nr:formimidoylglutamate deiminase [Stellaceae bacterium]